MRKTEIFHKEKLIDLFTKSKTVIDIGGGLRVSKKKGNRYNKNNEWMLSYLENVDYKILDPVPDYGPDIVGDIHALPFADDSQDAIVCMSVLEHVEDPITATKELYRVLKPGGLCFVYVPFLYYYHAEKGYYADYWRFTDDILRLLFKNFSQLEIQNTDGALVTWLRISPLGRFKSLVSLMGILDKVFHKEESKQTSGYYLYLKK